MSGTGTREGGWHYTLFIENGRVKDSAAQLMKTGLRTIAGMHGGDFRLTANQNLIIARAGAPEGAHRSPAAPVRPDQPAHRAAAQLDGLRGAADLRAGLGRERALPARSGSRARGGDRAGGAQGRRDRDPDDRCPNGCARPYLAEIGLVGRAPGKYNLYLGAAFDGSRLNKLYRKDLGHDEIVAALTPLVESYAKERLAGERFGDFVIRAGHVAPTTAGRDFHANLADDLRAA
jgi:sulfite reductase (NADPH) hemoprotein beta-component